MIVRICYISLPSQTDDHDAPAPEPENPDPKEPKKPNEGKEKKPTSFQLNFPALYPDVKHRKNSQCRTAWAELASIPCHEKLFDRGSDNGRFRLFGFDTMYFVPQICEYRCPRSLELALDQLKAECSPEDAFDMTNYDGMFNTDLLEAGPLAVVETLVRRLSWMCRPNETGDSDFKFCPIEMHYRFGVADGMNPNTEGIEDFVSDTNERRTEVAQWHRGSRGASSGGSSYRYRYNYRTRRQTYGPGDGQTSCGWCVFGFLNHTLTGWIEGGMPSADGDGKPMTLVEFIRRVRQAGKRCSPGRQWDDMYKSAIQQYQQNDLLPEDWETTLPSGGLDYLIRNGPSLTDPPVANISKALGKLEDGDEKGDAGSDIDASITCLSALRDHYTSAGCYINVPQDQLIAMLEPDHPLRHTLSKFCHESCTNAIDNWSSQEDCSEVQGSMTTEAQAFYDNYTAAKTLRTNYCNTVNDRWRPVSPCIDALRHMDSLSWVVSGRPDSSKLLEKVRNGLDEVETDYADLIRDGIDEDMSRDKKNKLEDNIRKSVCSNCIWKWLIGTNTNETVSYLESATSAEEYAATVDRYYKTCSSVAAEWLESAPFGDDPVIWRVKSQKGRVQRYINVPGTVWRDEATYYGNEGSQATHLIKSPQERPGIDYLTLWHFHLGYRAFQNSDRLDEWQKEEDLHRQKEDEKVWKIDKMSVAFKGGEEGGE